LSITDALLSELRAGVIKAVPHQTAQPTRRLFVSPDGSDANDGSFDRPFKTSKKGIKAATPGTAVVLRGGKHMIPAPSGTGLDAVYQLYPAVAGAIDAPCWLTGHEPDGLHAAELISTGNPSSGGIIGLSQRPHWLVDNLFLQTSVWGNTFRGIGGQKTFGVVMSRLKITGVAEDGIKFNQCQGGVHVLDCEIWDVGEEEVDFVAVVPAPDKAGVPGAGGVIAFNEFYHKGYHTGQGPVATPTIKAGTTDVLVVANWLRDVAKVAGYGIGAGAGGGSSAGGTVSFLPGWGTVPGDEYEAKRCHHIGNLVEDVADRAFANLGAVDCDFIENLVERGALTPIINDRGAGVLTTMRPYSLRNRYLRTRFVQAAGSSRIINGAGSTMTEEGSLEFPTVAEGRQGWEWEGKTGPRWKRTAPVPIPPPVEPTPTDPTIEALKAQIASLEATVIEQADAIVAMDAIVAEKVRLLAALDAKAATARARLQEALAALG
jgi:hypothetical protein